MWLAKQAAEAINNAKKGITEMTKETGQEGLDPKSEKVALQRSNAVYKRRIEEMNEEIGNYKNIIEDLMKEKKNLINFKIVIGRDDSDDPELEQFRLNTADLQEKLQQSCSEKEELKKTIEIQQFSIEKFEEKNTELQEKLKTLESNLSQSNEVILKSRQRVQKSVSDIYTLLKTSFESVGLSIPLIKPDQLGLEDIQEFIFTQSKYYEDSIQSFREICQVSGKDGKTLEELKKIFIQNMSEFTEGSKQARKTVKEIEGKLEKLTKEKEELFKISSKKDERIKVLIEQIGKYSEEVKTCQELKDENPRLQSQVRELQKDLEKHKDLLIASKKDLESCENKLKKRDEKIESFTNTNSNLTKRLKSVQSTLSEKEQQISSMQEASNLINTELAELKTNSEQYKKTSKKNLEDITSQNSAKLKELEESFSQKLKDSEKKVKDLLNEMKDIKLENIQLQNKVKRLEELERNLGYIGQQNSLNISRIDKLNIEKEGFLASLKAKDEEIENLNKEITKKTEKIEDISKDFLLEKEAFLIRIKESELVKIEAETLLKRVEQEMLGNDKMIDKRVIVTFLLNYTSEKYKQKAKNQMINALAEMLGMTPEERQKIQSPQEGFFSHFSGYLSRG